MKLQDYQVDFSDFSLAKTGFSLFQKYPFVAKWTLIVYMISECTGSFTRLGRGNGPTLGQEGGKNGGDWRAQSHS